MAKFKKGYKMKETVLPRPKLFIGIVTNNVGLVKDGLFIYMKVMTDIPDSTGKIRYYPTPGAKRVFKECKDLVEYIGPLDDEIIKNLLIYGDL